MRFEIFATAAVLAAPVVMAQGPPKWFREDPGAVVVGDGGVLKEFDSSPPAIPSPPPPANPSPSPAPPPPADSPAPVPAPSPVANSPSPSPQAPAPTPAPADPPAAPAAPAIDGGPGAMTWNIINKHGSPLSVIYGNNAGGPEPISATAGMMTSSTQIVFPTGWAGRVIIGPKDDVAGSKIEGSVMPQFNVDVSYVDGYTVPITCADHATGETIIGCNVDLFNNGQTCAEPGDGICYNTDTALHAFDGPPKPFFAPCAGAAYTFPNDNNADRVSTSPVVDCCVGAACPAPARQPGKRSLSNVARRWAYPRNVFE